jgi:hypothetical protein
MTTIASGKSTCARTVGQDIDLGPVALFQDGAHPVAKPDANCPGRIGLAGG